MKRIITPPIIRMATDPVGIGMRAKRLLAAVVVVMLAQTAIAAGDQDDYQLLPVDQMTDAVASNGSHRMTVGGATARAEFDFEALASMTSDEIVDAILKWASGDENEGGDRRGGSSCRVTLSPSDGPYEEPFPQHFGEAIAIDGDIMAVQRRPLLGAPYDLFIYRRSGILWIEEAKITNSDRNWLDSLAISNGRVAVARHTPDQVEIYEWDGGSWSMTETLNNPQSDASYLIWATH